MVDFDLSIYLYRGGWHLWAETLFYAISPLVLTVTAIAAAWRIASLDIRQHRQRQGSPTGVRGLADVEFPAHDCDQCGGKHQIIVRGESRLVDLPCC